MIFSAFILYPDFAEADLSAFQRSKVFFRPAKHVDFQWTVKKRSYAKEKALAFPRPFPPSYACMPLTNTWSSGLAWNTPGLLWSGGQSNLTTPMNLENKVSAVLTQEQVQTILESVQAVRTGLPFLLNMLASMKRRFPTIGTERAGMIETFNNAMANHPTLIPGFVDMPELQKDLALWSQMLPIISQVRELCEAVEDTHHAIGSDIFMAYLSFYNNVKQAAKRNVPGADTLLASLKPWFERASDGTPPAPVAEA